MKSRRDQVIEIHTPKPRFKVIDPIAKRFSPRWYSDEQIAKKDLDIIFEAARWAPSGYNAQPWQFYFLDKKSSKYKDIFISLSENNQRWAGSAPALIVATYQREDSHGPNRFAEYDLGASVISLTLQATELGYYTRQMGNIDVAKISKILKLSEMEIPFVVIAIGKLSSYEDVDTKILEMELTPRPRKEKVFEIIK